MYTQPPQNNWTALIPWQPWYQSQPWAQGWINPYGRYSQYHQYPQSYPNFPPQHFPQSSQPPQPQFQNQNP